MTFLGLVAIAILRSDDRVAVARHAKEAVLRRDLKARGLIYPPSRIYLRGLKRERRLELWVAPSRGPFRLFKTYAVQALSGALGPKRREGDLQVPEGFYTVAGLNPRSRFLLSLRLNYPNARDRAHASGPPGFDIFIHGNCVSAGCLAMGDDAIQEIYLLSAGARPPIRVDLYPTRMTDQNWGWLAGQGDPETTRFWSILRHSYLSFDRTHLVPKFKVVRGEYVLTGSSGS
ncbi:L,D-transpeptidase family protein [Fimbriimonas ginsengisoli]|uniref:ErfK/YbiS/YcfS/YnhG family protein n=1 Tax=Fimbriimonas ginsengisoli Gsoil 348 TaxID=661478 RepID=A0A068NPV6_FIMGI|nr:L,D-transpeptidase family protein [Fimbriimonas ginsengisoli]AIE84800.1 ErfK/YbiS/YcfS/YnhG family protein [Fimbriimonas ginsengisoli Gsoil 348]